MEHEKINEAAALFVRVRRSGVKLRELPESCRPQDAAVSNAIIREVTWLLDKPIGGWKITFLFRPRRKLPIIAPLFC